jgi:carboxypeptidase family protein
MRVLRDRVALLFLSGLAAFAQSGSGTISGTIFDPLGAPFADAVVTAKSATSAAVYSATSAAKGEYALTALPPGTYELTVAVRGQQMYAKPNVVVAAAKDARVDVKLEDRGQLSAIGDDFLAAAALDRKPVPTGPTPRALDGKPDLSGVWTPTRVVDAGKPEPLPWAEAVFKQRVENNGKDIPTAHCLPWGPVMDVPTAFEFVQSPSVIVILIEDVFSYRQIFLDGRGHSKDADPTWMGHSIGKWEGDTLVVDTAGFNDKSWSPMFRPHTDQFHMIERFRRPDLGHLEIEITIDDPGAYVKPWTMKRVSNLLAGDEIGEYVCAENNQDVEHLVGK